MKLQKGVFLMAKKRAFTVFQLTQMALLIALIMLASWQPVKIFIEITLCFVPVSFGAILLGPGPGAFLGLVWGLCSFAQGFGWFSPSLFGETLLGIDPWFYAVMCIVPRLLVGWLAGLLYKGFKRGGAKEWISCALTGALTAFLNTVFFVGTMLLLFGKTDYIQSFRAGRTVVAFVIGAFGVNCAVESAIGWITGMALSPVLPSLRKRR